MIPNVMADRIVLSFQIQGGATPTGALFGYYDHLMRVSKVAGLSYLASEYRQARDEIAGVGDGFFYDLAETSGKTVESIVSLFKDARVVKMFKAVGWSLSGLWNVLRKGHSAYRALHNAIAEYAAKSKVGRWTEEELKKLDAFLREHPSIKRIGGVLLGALLLYMWYNESFTGDPVFDFDISEVLAALSGSFSLADIFSGAEGMKLLAAFAAGMATGLTFPWPGPTTIHFAVAVITTLAKKIGHSVKSQPAVSV